MRTTATASKWAVLTFCGYRPLSDFPITRTSEPHGWGPIEIRLLKDGWGSITPLTHFAREVCARDNGCGSRTGWKRRGVVSSLGSSACDHRR